jgi:hypothetical protein
MPQALIAAYPSSILASWSVTLQIDVCGLKRKVVRAPQVGRANSVTPTLSVRPFRTSIKTETVPLNGC